LPGLNPFDTGVLSFVDDETKKNFQIFGKFYRLIKKN